MVHRPIHKSSSWKPQSQGKGSPFAPRSFTVQAQHDSHQPPTPEEIENEAFDQHKFEASGLQIKQESGTITPIEQERLGVLQTKMNDFWVQRSARAPQFNHNFANIPVHAPGQQGLAFVQSQPAIQSHRVGVPPQSVQPTIASAHTQAIGIQRATLPTTPHSYAMLPLQAKLTIGQPQDRYEQEADRVAAQVVNQINTPQPSQQGEPIQRQAVNQEKDDKLQMQPSSPTSSQGIPATPELEAEIGRSRPGGHPLASSIRKPMEQALGADFSRVKVHVDAKADQLNQSIQAKAFTTGQDIFFRQGEYTPDSHSGQELIAHELTHVVQQRSSEVAKPNGHKPSFPTHQIQTKGIQTTGDVIQRVSVREAIEKFEDIATQQNTQVSRDVAIRKRNAEIRQARVGEKKASSQVEPEVKSPPAIESADLQPVESMPTELESVPQSQIPETASASEPTSSNSESQTQDLNKQVGKNLEVLADGLFNMYNEPDTGLDKDAFKREYDELMQSAKKVLPSLILKKNQENPGEDVLLTFEEIGEAISELSETKELEEQAKPKITGRDRWNKLKKIAITDPSVPKKSRIKGKSKSLHYEDTLGKIRNIKSKTGDQWTGVTKEELSIENYWLEAWDALHRPAFALTGKEVGDDSFFADWIEETEILEWIKKQEKRDEEMITAFEEQKKQGGEVDFWKWKNKSKYVNTSPPPATTSFWDWLRDEDIPKVQYLEFEPERRSREVQVGGGTWKDVFGDTLSSEGLLAIGAPEEGIDWMIFVLSPDGKIYADAHKEGKYHHSSALAGVPVKAAGAIKVIGGNLKALSDKTGHYHANENQIYTMAMYLKKRGVEPKTYRVYTQSDKSGMQGDQWIEKYLQSDIYKKFLDQQSKNAAAIREREKKKS